MGMTVYEDFSYHGKYCGGDVYEHTDQSCCKKWYSTTNRHPCLPQHL